MTLHDILPAHFLSSSLHEEHLHQPPSQAPPSPTTTSPNEQRTKRSASPPSPSSNLNFPRLSASTSHPTPLPAPIGIPAARRRAPSAAAMNGRPPLSSSPTHTPFSVPTGSAARSGVNRDGTPVAPIVIPTSSPSTRTYTPPLANAVTSTATTSPTRRQGLTRSASTSGRPPGVFSTRGATPPSPTATTKRDVSSSPTTKKKWARIFDLDNMLGALDPNRLAAASCPEPVKTVVFGADHEAGFAVCRSLIGAKHYAITALTLDAECAESLELKNEGVRVVQVDMDNPGTYARELAGAKAVYLSSNVITLHAILQQQHEPKRTEIARAADRCQLIKAVKACIRAKVGHIVFRVNACGHEIVENVLGRNKTTFKLAIEEAPEDLAKHGIGWTILHTTVPYNRIVEWLDEHENGLVLNMPVPDETAIPFFAMEQLGEYMLAILRDPKKWDGKEVHAIADTLTPTQIAARLSKISRRPVDTTHPTRGQFMSLESHERLTCLWDAWAQLVRHEYVPDPSTKMSKHEVPDEWTFNDWIQHDLAMHKRLKF